MHVYNRGNRKMDIVKDEMDRWRFLACLRYFNDESAGEFLMRSVFGEKSRDNENNIANGTWRSNLHEFGWPQDMPPQKPIVKVISYCLMPNHYHLLLREIIQGGITAYMRKIGTGFTYYMNSRHKETGKLFQGSYKAKLVDDEEYLQYVDAYIQLLNPLELMGEPVSGNNFNKSFEMVVDNPLSSLGECVGQRNFAITDREEASKRYGLPKSKENYKKFSEQFALDCGAKKFFEDRNLEYL